MEKLRIGILISGTGSNMKAIIDACKAGKIDGEVVLVGSDNPEAKGLQYAKENDVDTFIIPYTELFRDLPKKMPEMISSGKIPMDFNFFEALEKEKFLPASISWHQRLRNLCVRAIAEDQIYLEMKSYAVDLLVLAGFMRVLSQYLIDKYNIDLGKPRIMNIHPALLPAFPGTDGYGDTFQYGCKIGGCTVHFIDYGEDTGPIIGQKAYEIYPDDTLDSIKERGLKNEWILYPECIQLFAENRLKVVEKNGRRVIDILPAVA